VAVSTPHRSARRNVSRPAAEALGASRKCRGNPKLDATLNDVGNFTGLISSGQSDEFGYEPLYRLTELSQGSSVLEHFDGDATSNRRPS
jgi:hypothetical protein